MTNAPLAGAQLTQIGLVVADIEAAARAWAAALGVPVPEIMLTDPVEAARTEYLGQSTPAQAKLAFIRLGQVTLELIEPVGAPSTWQTQLTDHGPSLHHLAFETTGLAGRLPALADAGLPLEQRGEYTGGRYAYFDGRRVYGAVVELLEND